MGQFVLFDHIVLLSALTGVLLERVRTRTETLTVIARRNGPDFGEHPEIEPLLRQMATLELATDRPLNDVTEAILHLGQ